MGQALHTSATGIKAAQTQINVVANNIANVNTAGFKASTVNFADIYYNTLSTGSGPTSYNGGTNPKQIGIGCLVASITKNFNGGSVSTTGITTDMNIQGNGFFTVMDPNKDVFYTRAGNFTLDADGYLTMGNGFRVLGTPNLFATASSDIPIHIPVLVDGKTSPNTVDIGAKPLNMLNAANISEGTFSIVITDTSAVPPAEVGNVTITIVPTSTLSTIAADITAQIGAFSGSASLVDGKMSVTAPAPYSLTFKAGTSNFVGATSIGANLPVSGGTYESSVLDYKQDINVASDMQHALKLQEINVSESGAIVAKYSNGDQLTVELNQNTNLYEFKYITAKGYVIKGADLTIPAGIAVPANFQMQLANFTNVNGLVQRGSNLYDVGANCGQSFYGAPATSGFGVMNTGAYEGSNVDITKEFSDMILAQRAIEANSRVFNTQNEVLRNLNYLGQ